jgi:hypothetical protein
VEEPQEAASKQDTIAVDRHSRRNRTKTKRRSKTKKTKADQDLKSSRPKKKKTATSRQEQKHAELLARAISRIESGAPRPSTITKQQADNKPGGIKNKHGVG